MDIKTGVELKDYTTFQIGGEALYFANVSSVEDAAAAVDFAQQEDLSYFVLGGGSNILASDQGFKGVVLHVSNDFYEVREQSVHVSAGMSLLGFLRRTADDGFTGLEGMAGVPGTVGGAVRGNAGAFGVEICDVATAVKAYNLETHEIKIFTREECAFSYRDSYFKHHPEWLIMSLACAFDRGDVHAIHAKMDETIAARESKHIQDIRSAGSFFVNPIAPLEVQQKFKEDTGVASKNNRVPAGWLLERCGISQKRIGDIQAGEMHANYFINVGEGTADQAVQLASLAKMRVRDTYGIQLQEEVYHLGF